MTQATPSSNQNVIGQAPPKAMLELVNKHGALLYVSHSAGKDSQAMTAYLLRHFPRSSIVVAHAHLDGMEWPGIIDHIKATIEGLPLYTCQARKLDGSDNTFEKLVLRRGSLGKPAFPSSAARFCTSDLKRGPLERTLKAVTKERGAPIVINCMGLRAGESRARKAMKPLKFNKRASARIRKVYDWLPIHSWTTDDVWSAIKSAGQEPHWAYSKGVSRLSCALCVLASNKDLAIGAKYNPEVYKAVQRMEETTGYTFRAPTKSNPNPTIRSIVEAVDLNIVELKKPSQGKQAAPQLDLFAAA